MFETWETQKRIAEAKRITARVVDHIQYLLDIHENNVIVLYSDTLSKQIPKSYAANAFNIFREAMHQIEVVRICALWDQPSLDRESILTVIELIDDQKVIDALADQARAGHPEEFGKQQGERAAVSLRSAIKNARAQRNSERLKSIKNLRDKHIAHYLSKTMQETTGTVGPMRVGDERVAAHSNYFLSQAALQTIFWISIFGRAPKTKPNSIPLWAKLLLQTSPRICLWLVAAFVWMALFSLADVLSGWLLLIPSGLLVVLWIITGLCDSVWPLRLDELPPTKLAKLANTH